MFREIKYIKLFQYGGPVAKLVLDGETHLFETEGVEELIRTQKLANHDTTDLERALNDMQAYRYAYYRLPELGDDDLSGQLTILE